MSTFKIAGKHYIGHAEKGLTRSVQKVAFDSFNPSVLGLGDITQDSKTIGAIAAFFDLEGFTNFCRQIDAQLSIPFYLNSFLEWIFECVRKETANETKDQAVKLWHDLPFLAKFMGDGILFLWKSHSMGQTAQHNLIISLRLICEAYKVDFLPKIKKKVVDAPPKLRCGIAKGFVYSVGNGEDYVGPCINMAARLQKLNGLTFAFSRRGFDPEGNWKPETMKNWTLKAVNIRGIGDGELVYIRKAEFDALPPDFKSTLKDV